MRNLTTHHPPRKGSVADSDGVQVYGIDTPLPDGWQAGGHTGTGAESLEGGVWRIQLPADAGAEVRVSNARAGRLGYLWGKHLTFWRARSPLYRRFRSRE